MDDRLKDIVIFEYEVDDYGEAINSFDILEYKLNTVRKALPDNTVIALPNTIKLKSLDDLFKFMAADNDDWMDKLIKVDTSEMRKTGDDE